MRPLHIGKATANLYKGWIESPLGCVLAWGKTANIPVDGTAGYGVGAMILDRTSAQPQFNVGTALSCKFRPNSGNIISTAASLDLGVANANQNLTVLADFSAGNVTLTLPPSTGHGNVVRVIQKVAQSTNSLIVNPAGTDTVSGLVNTISDDAGAAVKGYIGAGAAHVTLNGTTKGGTSVGESLIFTDDVLGVWSILGFTASTGTEATPFS